MSGARSGGDGGPGYLAPAAEARAELREKGSRFLAVVAPAADETAAAALLERLRADHPDATHHCWARRLGDEPRERSDDDGEPSGTAGVPILQVLRGAELHDVMAVVVRWFGGTKLGKGGLARAYAAAARRAVEELAVGRRVPRERLELEIPYELLGAVKRLVHPPDVELLEEDYGARVRLVLAVRTDRRRAVAAALADLGLADGLPPERR